MKSDISPTGNLDPKTHSALVWSELAPVPNPAGFAGAYVGVSAGSLLIAGGANFPDNNGPWGQSEKKFYDEVWTLETPESQWRLAGRLPKPLGYGVALTTEAGLLCIGGVDAERHYPDVFLVRCNSGQIEIVPMPALPFPLGNAAGALVRGKVYVAGGLRTPTAESAESAFLRFDPARPEQGWDVLSSWPGPGLMLATAGEVQGTFLLVGGAEIVCEPRGENARRIYHAETYIFEPESEQWFQTGSAPYPVVAAPSPALSLNNSLYVLGGDDGANADRTSELKLAHPGFRTDIISYDVGGRSWANVGNVPIDRGDDPVGHPERGTWVPITTPLVQWGNYFVLANGEVKPGVRTNRVRLAAPKYRKQQRV